MTETQRYPLPVLARALDALIKTEEFLPSIAKIHSACQAISRRMRDEADQQDRRRELEAIPPAELEENRRELSNFARVLSGQEIPAGCSFQNEHLVAWWKKRQTPEWKVERARIARERRAYRDRLVEERSAAAKTSRPA